MRVLLTAISLCLMTGCAPYQGPYFSPEQRAYYETYYPSYRYSRSYDYNTDRELKRWRDAQETRYRNDAQARGDLRAVFNSHRGAVEGGPNRYFWNRSDSYSYKPMSHGIGNYPTVPHSTFSPSRASSHSSVRVNQPRRSSSSSSHRSSSRRR